MAFSDPASGEIPQRIFVDLLVGIHPVRSLVLEKLISPVVYSNAGGKVSLIRKLLSLWGTMMIGRGRDGRPSGAVFWDPGFLFDGERGPIHWCADQYRADQESHHRKLGRLGIDCACVAGHWNVDVVPHWA